MKELDGIIDVDRYFLSTRIKTLKAIRAKIRPELIRPPLQGVQDAQLRQSEPVVQRVEHPPEDKPKKPVSHHRSAQNLREGSRTRAGNTAVALLSLTVSICFPRSDAR